MKTSLLKSFIAATLVWACLESLCARGWAQGTAFSYQGRLNDGAAPANGSYDLRFGVFDAATNGSQMGLSVTNAATAVSNGLFTVILDFGNQFPGANRWLEIAVRTNGAVAFTNLAPRQPLTATPYAVTAGNVTGPLNGAAIVSGTIGSAQLAAGAVTAAAIASNSIGNAQLSHHYLSGSVPFTSLPPHPVLFFPILRDYPVTFSTPFTTTPIITLALDTPHPALAGKGPLLITARNTNGFMFRVSSMPVGVEVVHNGNNGVRPTIRTVSGKPAVVGFGQVGFNLGLIYNRSLDADGDFPAPMLLPGGSYSGVYCLDLANGNPAITFIDALGGISYTRADDINGTNWPAETQIVTPATLGGSGKLLNGLMVNGNPAFAAANYTTNVYYLRADDDKGGSWGAPAVVFHATNNISAMSLAMVSGRPSIAVCAGQRIYFARANDTNGVSWPAFTVAVLPDTTNDVPIGSLTLLNVSSKPVIGYVGQIGINSPDFNLFVVQGSDVNGASWIAPQSAIQKSSSLPTPSFNLVNGVLCVAYTRDEVLHFSTSSFGGGVYLFSPPYDLEPAEGACSLETVDGQPAIAFYGNGALRFIRLGTPPPNSAVNWIAVEP
jgi:hypothetical protein